MITRREFIKTSANAAAGTMLTSKNGRATPKDNIIMTVNGPIDPGKIGVTLTHEHILADFIGAEKYSKDRYNADEVYNTALPFVNDLKSRGCVTFIDCSPAYLGRDVKILKRLADTTGLKFITNTGYYGAVGEKFLPKHAFTESAEQIASRWIDEFKNGIEGTGIKPGFIKTSVDGAPLTATQRKVIEAAALTHLATGLIIAIHTDNGKAANEELDILKSKGVSPAARIWVHAQKEMDMSFHVTAARAGSWISFEDIRKDNIGQNVDRLNKMKSEKLLDHVLISHDSGWYNVGEPKGGKYNGYTTIFDDLIPALKRNGFGDADVDLLIVKNPARAFTLGVKKI